MGEKKWFWDKDEDDRDSLLRDFDSVVRESSLLASFSGILFGFLLDISVNPPEGFSFTQSVTLLVAITSITVAISLFILPVIYHHLQYPKKDLEEFEKRVHKFLMFGFIPAGLTLYLGLELALSSLLNEFAFAIAAIPFVITFILFRKRKVKDPEIDPDI